MVYVCTAAKRWYAKIIWKILDRDNRLIPADQHKHRITSVALLAGTCHDGKKVVSRQGCLSACSFDPNKSRLLTVETTVEVPT